ncbi:MAG: hypothetical protein ACW96X_12040 [Promethearchaeota archaeon]|jgi:hypothetical protein
MDTTYFYFEMPEIYRGKYHIKGKAEENKDISARKHKNDKINKLGEKNSKS